MSYNQEFYVLMGFIFKMSEQITGISNAYNITSLKHNLHLDLSIIWVFFQYPQQVQGISKVIAAIEIT